MTAGGRSRRQSIEVTTWSACACRSRSIARPACASCSMRWQIEGALHVDHEHAAAALPQAHSRASTHRCARGCYTDPRVWDSFDPKKMTLSSPDPQAIPSAGRQGQRAAGQAADQFQVRALRRRQGHRDRCATSRRTSRPPASTRRRRQDRIAGEAQGATNSIFVPLAKWSMLLAGNYRCITKDGMRTARKRCTRTSRNRARSTISCSICA